jgi:hypothetical protein
MPFRFGCYDNGARGSHHPPDALCATFHDQVNLRVGSRAVKPELAADMGQPLDRDDLFNEHPLPACATPRRLEEIAGRIDDRAQDPEEGGQLMGLVKDVRVRERVRVGERGAPGRVVGPVP